MSPVVKRFIGDVLEDIDLELDIVVLPLVIELLEVVSSSAASSVEMSTDLGSVIVLIDLAPVLGVVVILCDVEHELDLLFDPVVLDLELCLFGLDLDVVALWDVEVSTEFVVELCDLLVLLGLDLVLILDGICEVLVDVVPFPVSIISLLGIA